ncbi:hypothetical protein GE061_001427 [Apolygus lucorum]|uniref:Uncharacterized protein n=1 Tax=Apolygus lucorum TaxID=248454 RepID=A0A8S9Y8E3_APOLU|nr:hypothetical protein GE061_001427 [Apolygus lucorum]
MSNEELLPTTVPTRRPHAPPQPGLRQACPSGCSQDHSTASCWTPKPETRQLGDHQLRDRLILGPQPTKYDRSRRSRRRSSSRFLTSMGHATTVAFTDCIPLALHDMTTQTPTTEPVVSGVCTATAATQTSNHGTSKTEPVVKDIPRHPVPYNTPPSRHRSPSMTTSRATSCHFTPPRRSPPRRRPYAHKWATLDSVVRLASRCRRPTDR